MTRLLEKSLGIFRIFGISLHAFVRFVLISSLSELFVYVSKSMGYAEYNDFASIQSKLEDEHNQRHFLVPPPP